MAIVVRAPSTDRRDFLKMLAAGLAGTALVTVLPNMPPAPPALTAENLAELEQQLVVTAVTDLAVAVSVWAVDHNADAFAERALAGWSAGCDDIRSRYPSAADGVIGAAADRVAAALELVMRRYDGEV